MAAKRKYFWNENFYVKAYKLALSGMSATDIGKALGIDAKVWRHWLNTKKALKQAIEEASKPAPGEESASAVDNQGQSIIGYVFDRLPANLQNLWIKLGALNKGYKDEKGKLVQHPDICERIDRLFEKEGGKQARQYLWIHAFIRANFNRTAACRMVNVSYPTLQLWEKEPDFKEMVAYIPKVMHDFGVGQYWRHVAAGTESIVRHMADNFLANGDPQYARKKIGSGDDDSGEGITRVRDINIVLNNMPLEKQKELLEHMRLGQNVLPPKEVHELEPVKDETT